MLLSDNKSSEKEQLLNNILDTIHHEIFIVDSQKCEFLHSNAAANTRLNNHEGSGTSCKISLAADFPRLCSHCLSAQFSTGRPFDVTDIHDKIYEATIDSVAKNDGDSATVITLHNVDENRRHTQNLYTLAYLDHLTEIPNRQKLTRDFQPISQNKAHTKYYAVIAIFDIDYFKSINDTYGHNTGDVMLKRLTEHLEEIPELSGHLYRLGGDEFVLYFVDEQSAFKDLSDYRRHCDVLLSRALRTYTMPNIDMTCTVSMGAALYPEDGISTSELLRKADIALYESKANGRNQLTFFESRLDTSNKKFTDYFINICPVTDIDGKTFAYELSESCTINNRNNTTTLDEVDRAIEAIAPNDLANNFKYFIRYSNKLETKAVLNNIGHEKFVIQIPVPHHLSRSDIRRCAALKNMGYLLALTEIDVGNVSKELIELVDYCRFSQRPSVEMMQKQVISSYPAKKFIATNINTQAQYIVAKKLGFRLFQGSFLNQPAIIKKEKDIDPLRANYYRLLRLSSTDDYVDFNQVSDIIASDVALSYKLLRILNSPAVGLRHRMSSIPMAVSYMGEDALKKWIALLAIRGVANDKPLEIIRTSLIRAHFGELLSKLLTPNLDSNRVFMVGMFSLLHIALDKTQEELLDEITVDDDVRRSLLGNDGPYSELLAFFDAYERSIWDNVSTFAERNEVSGETIYQTYLASVRWYNDLNEK